MKQYFEAMPKFGSELSERQIKGADENIAEIDALEAALDAEIERVKNAGMPLEKLNARGQMSCFRQPVSRTGYACALPRSIRRPLIPASRAICNCGSRRRARQNAVQLSIGALACGVVPM